MSAVMGELEISDLVDPREVAWPIEEELLSAGFQIEPPELVTSREDDRPPPVGGPGRVVATPGQDALCPTVDVDEHHVPRPLFPEAHPTPVESGGTARDNRPVIRREEVNVRVVRELADRRTAQVEQVELVVAAAVG
jgi:hypothetical protein